MKRTSNLVAAHQAASRLSSTGHMSDWEKYLDTIHFAHSLEVEIAELKSLRSTCKAEDTKWGKSIIEENKQLMVQAKKLLTLEEDYDYLEEQYDDLTEQYDDLTKMHDELAKMWNHDCSAPDKGDPYLDKGEACIELARVRTVLKRLIDDSPLSADMLELLEDIVNRGEVTT